MFTTLTDNSKAAIFTVIVLLLAVTVAASIDLFSITSEFLSIVLYMFTPALTALIMTVSRGRAGSLWGSTGLASRPGGSLSSCPWP
jgi:multisubunit Na+/H+ antiporter MnhG subunit